MKCWEIIRTGHVFLLGSPNRKMTFKQVFLNLVVASQFLWSKMNKKATVSFFSLSHKTSTATSSGRRLWNGPNIKHVPLIPCLITGTAMFRPRLHRACNVYFKVKWLYFIYVFLCEPVMFLEFTRNYNNKKNCTVYLIIVQAVNVLLEFILKINIFMKSDVHEEKTKINLIWMSVYLLLLLQ